MIPPVLSLLIGLPLAIISIVKGKLRRENVLFSLVCIWWSCLLAPAFISHHLFRGDEKLLLQIERVIHFFFVYSPLVNLIYMFEVLNIKRRGIIIAAAVLSFIISLFTQTDLYFTGLYSYSWGYIAKGNIVFDIFGAYGMIVIAYIAYSGIKKFRSETNYIMKIKIKFIVFSIIASAVLTVFNVPAINGIDFYPLGNLNFIPLAILAYGVLRFRLMDIRSIIHVTIVWAVVSSLVIIPNIFMLVYFWSEISSLQAGEVAVILTAWFSINYFYLRRVQPFIDQLFNKRKFDLSIVETRFFENITHLKTFKELVNEFTDILKKTLSFSDFKIINRDETSGGYILNDGSIIELDEDLKTWFIRINEIVNRSLVETDPVYLPVRDELTALFKKFGCEFIIPFIQNAEIIGFMTMPERSNLQQLHLDELRFINNIKNSASIALSNSLMYQNLTNYKNNLEIMVENRTKELKAARDALWGEMELAKKIQTVLLPEKPDIAGYEISGYMRTADLVGGDYYDVINVGGLNWIVIGDVSGHGVSAGLIMMMVQTSIHSVLTVAGDLKPSDLLGKVNSVITENIRRLHEDKYMTITVLACLQGGRFYYSGLHQDIMIYRASSGTVDTKETNGIWIGIEENINRLITDEELSLEHNDVMLLYSDGITEAWKEGSVKGKRDTSDMYTQNRLEEVFKKSGGSDPDEIKSAIIDSLNGYDCDDDVTMLILKRTI
jgi:serine phosphatase RsbU (regulator of sigma subunit)